MAMQTKRNLRPLAPFVLTLHVAGKGTDRYYAWPVALFPPKEEGVESFSIKRTTPL